MSDLGCHIGVNVIACKKEAGTGCPGADGDPETEWVAYTSTPPHPMAVIR